MHGIGDAIAGAMVTFMLCVFGGGFFLGWLLFDGLPMLWDWAKPILHTLTAS